MIKKSIDFIGKKCYASGYRVVQGIGQSSIEKLKKNKGNNYYERRERSNVVVSTTGFTACSGQTSRSAPTIWTLSRTSSNIACWTPSNPICKGFSHRRKSEWYCRFYWLDDGSVITIPIDISFTLICIDGQTPRNDCPNSPVYFVLLVSNQRFIRLSDFAFN